MSFLPKLTAKKTKKISVPGSDASITIKYIKPGVMQALIQSTLNVVSKQADASEKMMSEVSFNIFGRNKLIVQECVEGWVGFTNEEDKPLKFSAMNLAKMIEESDDFVDFIVKEHDKFTEEIEAEFPEIEKN